MRLWLPESPFFANEVIEPGAELLDELARDHDGNDPLAFLFGVAPARAFERMTACEPGELPLSQHLWIMHVSGYFGGVWLRSEILRAQPGSMLLQLGSDPGREAFLAIAERAQAAVLAARGESSAALAYVETAFPEIVSGFGYNQGYLLQILETPPAGLQAPDAFLIPRGPLWCDYGRSRLEPLEALRPVAQKLARPPSLGWRKLAASLPDKLAAEVERGRLVWSSGLSVQGFSQSAYEQLLDVSSSFLEIVQATALVAARALAERDVAWLRRAALANACLAPWLGSYAQGLMDKRGDASGPRLPAFR